MKPRKVAREGLKNSYIIARAAPGKTGATMTVKELFITMSLGLAAALFTTTHAQAEPANCAARGQIVDRLEQGYGETRQSIGLGQDNSLVEIFASAETGTWSILVTMTNGLSCLVASGESFEVMQEQVVFRGEKA